MFETAVCSTQCGEENAVCSSDPTVTERACCSGYECVNDGTFPVSTVQYHAVQSCAPEANRSIDLLVDHEIDRSIDESRTVTDRSQFQPLPQDRRV